MATRPYIQSPYNLDTAQDYPFDTSSDPNSFNATPADAAFQRQAIAEYNSAKWDTRYFEQNISKPQYKNNDVANLVLNAPPSSQSAALSLTAEEMVRLLLSDNGFDSGSYSNGLNRRVYAESTGGVFGIVVDLEEDDTPKLFIAKVIKLCGEWGPSANSINSQRLFVGVAVRGTYPEKYGVLIVADSVVEKEVMPSLSFDTENYRNEEYNSGSCELSSTNDTLPDVDGIQSTVDRIPPEFPGYQSLSDAQLARQINDWICRRTSYRVGHYGPANNIVWGQLAWYGEAVCDGYARSMVAICRLLGLQARYITGYAVNTCGGGGGHAWAQVQIDGVWKHYDPTWVDTGGSGYWLGLPGVNGDLSHRMDF